MAAVAERLEIACRPLTATDKTKPSEVRRQLIHLHGLLREAYAELAVVDTDAIQARAALMRVDRICREGGTVGEVTAAIDAGMRDGGWSADSVGRGAQKPDLTRKKKNL